MESRWRAENLGKLKMETTGCGCCCGCELCVPGPGQGCATILQQRSLGGSRDPIRPLFFFVCWCWCVLLISSPALPRADSPQPSLQQQQQQQQQAVARRSGASFGSHGCTRTDRASTCRPDGSVLYALPSRRDRIGVSRRARARGDRQMLSPSSPLPLRTTSRTEHATPGVQFPNSH